MNTPSNHTGPPRRILVVDDQEDMRVLLRQLLERAGYQVQCAADGRTGLIEAQHAHPDLIIMDLVLPDMHGWEVVARLRQMPELHDTPVVAVSVYISAAEREQARAVGCTVHIGKPFDAAMLLRSITDVLRDRQAAEPGN